MVNSVDAGYNKEWEKVSLSTNLFYRYATNTIRSYIDLKSNGVAFTHPMNFGNLTTYGFEGIVSIFPTRFYSANTSVSFYQQNIDGSNVSSDVATNVFSWYGKIINNFNDLMYKLRLRTFNKYETGTKQFNGSVDKPHEKN